MSVLAAGPKEILRAAALGAGSRIPQYGGRRGDRPHLRARQPQGRGIRLGGRTGTVAATLAAAGELVVDKLPCSAAPGAPAGAVCESAAAMADRDQADATLPTLAGLASATAASVCGHGPPPRVASAPRSPGRSPRTWPPRCWAGSAPAAPEGRAVQRSRWFAELPAPLSPGNSHTENGRLAGWIRSFRSAGQASSRSITGVSGDPSAWKQKSRLAGSFESGAVSHSRSKAANCRERSFAAHRPVLTFRAGVPPMRLALLGHSALTLRKPTLLNPRTTCTAVKEE